MDMKEEDVNLDKFSLDFGKDSGDMIYMEYASGLSNREFAMLLGYKTEGKSGFFSCVKDERNGRYKASRFKMMCEGLKIIPGDILKKYTPAIAEIYHCRPINKETENNVIRKICDK